MKQSKIITLELEVEVEWDEDDNGTVTYLDSTCHTLCPITIEAWARHEAWMRLARRK